VDDKGYGVVAVVAVADAVVGKVLHSQDSMKEVDVGGTELGDTRHSGAVHCRYCQEVGTTTVVVVIVRLHNTRRCWYVKGEHHQDHDDVDAAVAEDVAEADADLYSWAVGECDIAVADSYSYSYSSEVDTSLTIAMQVVDSHNDASVVPRAAKVAFACP
jgi:hypothetical protein